MGLTKRTDSGAIFLQAKHNCLWQEFKLPIQGKTIPIEVTNPRTKQAITKHGIPHETLEGFAQDLIYYNRTDLASGTKFVGWKLRIKDGDQLFILDVPYKSRLFQTLSMAAPNIDWSQSISITIFKGKNKKGADQMAVWLRQQALTIKLAYTRDHPNGLPPAKHDSMTDEWDFREQEKFLALQMRDVVAVKIREAASIHAEPPEHNEDPGGDDQPGYEELAGPPPNNWDAPIDDDDVPF